MEYRDVIRQIMRADKITGAELSRRLGKSSNYISETLPEGREVRAGLLLDIFHALGYRVEVWRDDSGFRFGH